MTRAGDLEVHLALLAQRDLAVVETTGDTRETEVGNSIGDFTAVRLGVRQLHAGSLPPPRTPSSVRPQPPWSARTLGMVTDRTSPSAEPVLPWRRRRPRAAGTFLSPVVRRLAAELGVDPA